MASGRAHDDQSFRDEWEFVSEAITPEPGSFSADLMATGLASLPRAFSWRGRRFEILECLEHRKQTSAEGGRAVGDVYLRRQVFVVRLDSGQVAELYFERNARVGARGKAAKRRWFLYALASGG